MKHRILSISYDASLLTTRQLILEAAGYAVVSVLGFTEALHVCKTRHDFDMMLMGHSIPQKDKIALSNELRLHCQASLLSILRYGDSPIPQAEYWVEANAGPEALLVAVQKAFERRMQPGHPDVNPPARPKMDY